MTNLIKPEPTNRARAHRHTQTTPQQIPLLHKLLPIVYPIHQLKCSNTRLQWLAVDASPVIGIIERGKASIRIDFIFVLYTLLFLQQLFAGRYLQLVFDY